ncbi:uncharacterized protein LOC132696347 [Cylas formicarius]|uniref:uncharacterized protein LOC132696347 n=1 Tax=Cylas formicarius TaxID=197179 RepID=UPI0029583C20|nr:uncharacterized protein LOC132696347 [Cylas formicarius]
MTKFLAGYLGLRNLHIKVPKIAASGKDLKLQCTFDLEGERLYQLKWYSKSKEFYRYTPSDPKPIKQYGLEEGIRVKESESNDTVVVLEDITRKMSGPFSCEVTEEVSFFTAMKTAYLEVVDLPLGDFYISGVQKYYHLNDILSANCTVEKSCSGANITWYINGMPIRHGTSKHTTRSELCPTVYSHLRIRVDRKYFANPYLRVRCAASIYNLYHNSREETAFLWERRKVLTTTESPFKLTENDEYTKLLFSFPPQSDKAGSRFCRTVLTATSLISLYFFS